MQTCGEITSYKNNRVMIARDFNISRIDEKFHCARGLDGLEFLKCVQEMFCNTWRVPDWKAYSGMRSGMSLKHTLRPENIILLVLNNFGKR